ncbi:MAG: hypothetical protein C4582_11220 [Desulfobacteraceae bacterium]|nr:MAG: hypothetical protein C4582_11220 [Desulfobacteraceae bacterium]
MKGIAVDSEKEKKGEDFPILGCPGSIEIPTQKEQKALERLRTIKKSVRELKERLGKLESNVQEIDHQEISRIKTALEELREDWGKWQQRREQAAADRMVLLGHEKAPTK